MTWAVRAEDMAAPTVESSSSSVSEEDQTRTDSDSESRVTPKDPGYSEHVAELLEREVGTDLKSVKNVGPLLERLKAENALLEEQVKTPKETL